MHKKYILKNESRQVDDINWNVTISNLRDGYVFVHFSFQMLTYTQGVSTIWHIFSIKMEGSLLAELLMLINEWQASFISVHS